MLASRNESEGPEGSSCGLAREAGSNKESFSSWLWLRTRDDEPREAGGNHARIHDSLPIARVWGADRHTGIPANPVKS